MLQEKINYLKDMNIQMKKFHKLIGKELHKHPSRSIFHTLLEPVAGMNLESSNF
jgi:hypothetical protein